MILKSDLGTYIVGHDSEVPEVPHYKDRLLFILNTKMIWTSDGEKWNFYGHIDEGIKGFVDEAVSNVRMRGLCD